jgi:hypothetical protein
MTESLRTLLKLFNVVERRDAGQTQLRFTCQNQVRIAGSQTKEHKKKEDSK